MGAIKQTEEAVNYVKSLMDEQGRACLDIRISASSEIFNPMTFGVDLDLNEAVYSFIDQRAAIIPPVIPLHLRIHGQKVPPEDQKRCHEIIARHYALQMHHAAAEMAEITNKLFLMLLLGAIGLAAGIWLSATDRGGVLSEILSIIASFALCEAATSFFLDIPKMKAHNADLEQSKEMTLEFLEE